jgi:Spy/CpxP family protein refolding chaperone
LGLTDEQITEIQSILDANKEQKEATKNSIKEIHTALKEQSMTGEYNEEKVQTLANHISTMVVLKSKERFNIIQILTDEQKSKLEEMLTFFKSRRGHSGADEPES